MKINNRPLFSIATPCFNSEKTIERTIKSVLAQEFKDYEYIIVDGGSKDATLDIVRRYEPLFEGRMRWQSEPDKGIYDAFNKGVMLSHGKYCWNVNSDDWIEKDCLTKLSEIISENTDIIIGALNWVNEDGTLIRTSVFNKERVEYAYKHDKMIPHPSTIVAKWVYDKYGVFDIRFKIAGDMDWFHRVYPKSDIKFAIIETPLNNMSIGGVSTSNNTKQERKDRFLFYRKKYPSILLHYYHFLYWLLRTNINRFRS